MWDSETRLYLNTRDYYVPYDCTDQRIPTLTMGEEDAQLRSELETPIRDYQRENLAQFCLGNQDLESGWDAYVAGFDGLRLNEYIELLDKYYQMEYVD